MVCPRPEGEGRALTKVAIKRALISVYDKTGLTDLARALDRAGVEIVSTGSTAAECVEQIDIGGPAMVRAAAKNHANVAVVTDPSMYAAVTEAVAGGGFTLAQRRRLAARAYAHTARYDAAVASWFASVYAPDG